MKIHIRTCYPVTAIGLRQIIEQQLDQAEVTVSHADEETQEYYNNDQYDIVLLDIEGNLDTIKTFLKLHQKLQPYAGVLVCGDEKLKHYELDLITSGASGFIEKNSHSSDFIQAIEIVKSGLVYLSQSAVSNLKLSAVRLDNNSPLKKLSKREKAVYKGLIKGEKVNDISKRLGLHQSSISTMKKRILEKTGAENVIELVTRFGQLDMA